MQLFQIFKKNIIQNSGEEKVYDLKLLNAIKYFQENLCYCDEQVKAKCRKHNMRIYSAGSITGTKLGCKS